ncbi:MAG TPA: helix-turn-helix transcriptional regulator [Pseudonocardiaceae bacterium]
MATARKSRDVEPSRNDPDLIRRRKALARRARMARAALGLTQEQVAARAGLVTDTYNAIERGTSNTRLLNLWAVADALEVPLAELFAE